MKVLPKNSFCERMQTLIELLGSQEKLGAASGVSGVMIGKYALGKAEPARDKLITIANAAGVNVAWLATGEGPMKREEGRVINQIQESGNLSPQIVSDHHEGDVYIYNTTSDPHQARPELAELVVLMENYANKAMIEEIKDKLLKIKKVMEGE